MLEVVLELDCHFVMPAPEEYRDGCEQSIVPDSTLARIHYSQTIRGNRDHRFCEDHINKKIDMATSIMVKLRREGEVEYKTRNLSQLERDVFRKCLAPVFDVWQYRVVMTEQRFKVSL